MIDATQAVLREEPKRLWSFAKAYVETGDAPEAIRKASIQNPRYRIDIWADVLLENSDVRSLIEKAKALREEKRQSDRAFAEKERQIVLQLSKRAGVRQ